MLTETGNPRGRRLAIWMRMRSQNATPSASSVCGSSTTNSSPP